MNCVCTCVYSLPLQVSILVSTRRGHSVQVGCGVILACLTKIQQGWHLFPFLCWNYCACACMHVSSDQHCQTHGWTQTRAVHRHASFTMLRSEILHMTITIYGVLIEQIVIVDASSILLTIKTCVVPITLWEKSSCRNPLQHKQLGHENISTLVHSMAKPVA